MEVRTNGRRADRQRRDATQLKVWVAAELKNDFMSVCAVQGVTASDVLRGLLAAYVERVSGRCHG